jgi:hypothetical protein
VARGTGSLGTRSKKIITTMKRNNGITPIDTQMIALKKEIFKQEIDENKKFK